MKKRKILVVFYSRTGATKKVGEKIAKKLDADVEEIFDLKNRKGVIGWLYAGRDAMKKKHTEIKNLTKNISEYELVVVGSPVWAGALSPGIRTFLHQNKHKIKNIAFFCTQGGENPGKIFFHMQELAQKKPISILSLRTNEVMQNKFEIKLNKFIEELK